MKIAWIALAALAAAAPAALAAPLNIPTHPGAPGHPSAAKQADALVKAGDVAMQEREFGSAVAFYRQAATLTPKDLTPQRRLGAALLAAGAVPDADTVWRHVLTLAPGDFEAQVALGKIAVRLGKPTQAVGFLTAAKAVRDDAGLENAMGVALDFQGQHVAAQAAYRAGLALAPASPSLRNNLGLSLALSGDYPAAELVLSQLAGEATASARYRLNLALVYGLAGDDAKAAAAARKDLGEADNAANRQYYRALRAMNDAARTRAVFEGEIGVAEPAAKPKAG